MRKQNHFDFVVEAKILIEMKPSKYPSGVKKYWSRRRKLHSDISDRLEEMSDQVAELRLLKQKIDRNGL